MFVRFRQTARRLQASLIVTRRANGRIHHEHIASLGSVPLAPSPADRIAFWTKLHQRLDALANRVDAAQRGATLAAIHARIPMPTMDEHQAVQLEHATADARFWQSLSDLQADDLEGHRELLATTQRNIAAREKAASDTVTKAQAAKDRLARAEQGEAVAVPLPMTRKEILRVSGMTEAEARHCQQVAEIAARGDDWWRLMLDERDRRRLQAEKTVVRKLHRMVMPRRRAPSV